MRRHNREENVHLGQSGHVESRLVVSITGVVMIRHGHVALKTVQAVSGKLRVSRAVPGWAAQLVVCLLSVCPVSLHSQLFRGKMRPELSWAGLGEELWQVELWVETEHVLHWHYSHRPAGSANILFVVQCASVRQQHILTRYNESLIIFFIPHCSV